MELNRLLANFCKWMQICGMTLDAAILRALTGREITEQVDLLEALKAEGYDLTLSTLSRHLKKLQVRKEGGRYLLPGARRPGAPAFTLRKVPPCLLILKTSPGFANAMALALDGGGLPALAGTIAGDDTIFAAPLEPALLDQLEGEVLDCLGRGF
jgi:transcriptional regulator of arginine metabolism